MKYAFILNELMAYPLSVVCWVLGVTKSGFHAWRGRALSKRAQERDCLSATLRKVFDAHRGRYGAPRICRVLRECHGYRGSLNRIQKLMRALGLRAKAGRKYKATTDSGHSLPVAPNLLGQDFSCDTNVGSTSHAKAPNQVWLSDITYLWTREGWLYVCAVLDLFTRRIVGWAIAEHMTRQLVLDALRMAYATRKPAPGLIFHSDRGSQYASADVRRWLAERGIRQSMSGTGNCYDLFAGDASGRGARCGAALERYVVAWLVSDVAEGVSRGGVGLSAGFSRRYVGGRKRSRVPRTELVAPAMLAMPGP